MKILESSWWKIFSIRAVKAEQCEGLLRVRQLDHLNQRGFGIGVPDRNHKQAPLREP
jgi:hypothetical protein